MTEPVVMPWGEYMTDEYDAYHEEMLRDPAYAEAYRRAGLRRVEDARERRVARIVRRLGRRR